VVKIVPGVYVETKAEPYVVYPAFRGGVVGFVGQFEYGPENELIYIRSISDMQKYLGGLTTDDAKSLYAMLLQRPKKVVVVRVVGSDAAKASLTLQDSSAADSLKLTAKYYGTYGNDITVKVDSTEGKMTITYADITETYDLTDIDSLVNNINSQSELVVAEKLGDNLPADITNTLEGGSDGTVDDNTYIGNYDPSTGKRSGLYVLEEEPEIDIVTIGGTPSQTKNTALIEHARKNLRLAICPLSDGTNLTNALTEAANYVDSDGFSVLAFPNVIVEINNEEVEINMAYLYAGTLARIEAHRSTANVPVYGVSKLTSNLTYENVEELIENGINPVTKKGRYFVFRHGITTSNESVWKQVQVRRVFNLLSHNLDSILDEFVGRPHLPELWAHVRAKLEAYMRGVKTAGWVFDFRVKCDEELNPPEVREQGILNARVDIQPTYAALFITVVLNKVLNFETNRR